MFAETPKSIRTLIIATVSITLGSGLFNRFLGTQELLGLSWINFYPWQPLSYLFVANGAGISVGMLIELFFHMYLLWFMGTSIVQNFDDNRFLRLYFTSGILAGIVALLLLIGTPYHFLGAGPAIYAVMIAWSMIDPYQEMLLFFSLRIQARWMALALLGIVALIDISQGDLLHLAAYATGALSGYFYAVIAWDLRGPFEQTHGIDNFFARIGEGFRNWRARQDELSSYVDTKAKIVDISSGKAVLDDDDVFMDAMLDKISRFGKESLSKKEQKRMDAISHKKAKSL